MSDQDLFFDEDEATGRASAPDNAAAGGPVKTPAKVSADAAGTANAAPAVTAPSPALHSVSLTVALLMTLAGLLAGVIVGLLIPAA